MQQIVYCNGMWSPWRKTGSDLGLWRADGAVEVLEARRETMFHPEKHLERLAVSCAGYKDLDMALLPSKEEILSKVDGLLKKENHESTIIHILATPGQSKDLKKSDGLQELIIDVRELEQTPENPFKLRTVDAVRYFPHCKLTAGYGYARRFLADAEADGFNGILYQNQKTGLCEGAYQNFFAVRDDGVLITPKFGVLFGITREIVLDLARKSAIFKDVVENSLWFWQLHNCKEVFLTSTTLGVAPIAEITSGLSGTRKTFKIAPENTFSSALKEKFLNYREEYFTSRGA